MHAPNPLARRDYPRRAAIQKDLDRYYGDCMTSSTARRFRTTARRENYCSRVSWKIARQAGRYPDYFRVVKENPMTASPEERRQVKLAMQAGHDHAKTQLKVFNVGDPRREEMGHAQALAYFERRLSSDLAEIAALEYARTWEAHHDLPKYRRSDPPGAPASRNPIGTSAGIVAVGVGLASAIAYGFSKLATKVK
jgi:hypothetical protein